MKTNYTLKIKKLHDDTALPTLGSEYAAGYDLYAYLNDEYSMGNRRITIPSHGTVKIGTGISMAVPQGYFGAIFARSGLATKQGLRPANCVGVVDCDYRGEVIVALHNDSDTNKIVTHGDRIAQLVLLPYQHMAIKAVAELDETERGEGGFGSTGKN